MKKRTPVTLGEVASLPLVLDPVTAGRMLGLGRTTTYRLLREGSFPVPARRAGRVWVVPTAGVLAHLGIDPFALHQGRCGCGARTGQKETES
ncbi:helix-turn-helix transcriptional regulator [Nocardiopsis sp. LOL_012]|uniref:helix-turn-helix transcriptional regulator n=1 Tax=Nocardiopsis sp. LOL_012 TaxID=3345409 RepID=UPI003A859335